MSVHCDWWCTVHRGCRSVLGQQRGFAVGSSSWAQCSVGWSSSEQRWWSGSCHHVLAAWRQKLLCPRLSQLSHVSDSKSQSWAPQPAVPFCCPGTEISSWFFPQSIIAATKKNQYWKKLQKNIQQSVGAVKLVVVEGSLWVKLRVREGVLNLMIKCSTAAPVTALRAQNVSGHCLKMVEFAEMKGGQTDPKLSVFCTCLVYLFCTSNH